MIRLIYAVNVPYMGYRVVPKGDRLESVPCIRHRDLYFNLCEVCGTQVLDKRRTKTCSSHCNEIYWNRVQTAERNQNCRPIFWNTFREEAMDRDGRKCTHCGSTDALEVHHIVPVHAGGTNTKENLTTLCHGCHVKIHAEERENLRREKERAATQAVLNQHGGKSIEDWVSTTPP